jgi:hypothetical protein
LSRHGRGRDCAAGCLRREACGRRVLIALIRLLGEGLFLGGVLSEKWHSKGHEGADGAAAAVVRVVGAVAVVAVASVAVAGAVVAAHS